MQPLATEFEDRTFRYTQLVREGDIAIFEQRHKDSGVRRYEVVRIRVQPPHTWPNGDVSPEREVYPGAGSWGRDGFTTFTLAEAQTLAQGLQQNASATQEHGEQSEATHAPAAGVRA